MIIYPAIDIRDGNCVRLVEGDFDRETVFGDDPAVMARHWESSGAEWIHIVDLDGAESGAAENQRVLTSIRKSVTCKLQVGGGIRSAETARTYLQAGFNRVILGTIAITDRSLVERLAREHPGQIAVGLDARNGRLAGGAWLDQTEVEAETLASELLESGVETLIYTDIARDGTLSGPNLEAIKRMVVIAGDRIIASGGVGNLDHIDALSKPASVA